MVAIATMASLQNSTPVYCASSTVDFLRKHMSLFSITSLKCSSVILQYMYSDFPYKSFEVTRRAFVVICMLYPPLYLRYKELE